MTERAPKETRVRQDVTPTAFDKEKAIRQRRDLIRARSEPTLHEDQKRKRIPYIQRDKRRRKRIYDAIRGIHTCPPKTATDERKPRPPYSRGAQPTSWQKGGVQETKSLGHFAKIPDQSIKRTNFTVRSLVLITNSDRHVHAPHACCSPTHRTHPAQAIPCFRFPNETHLELGNLGAEIARRLRHFRRRLPPPLSSPRQTFLVPGLVGRTGVAPGGGDQWGARGIAGLRRPQPDHLASEMRDKMRALMCLQNMRTEGSNGGTVVCATLLLVRQKIRAGGQR